eukprot:Rhum_TRINITY_DN14426_c3_g1::Rhum_TRINITY_DN14426_c3_g1_i1::g.87165::m.87165
MLPPPLVTYVATTRSHPPVHPVEPEREREKEEEEEEIGVVTEEAGVLVPLLLVSEAAVVVGKEGLAAVFGSPAATRHNSSIQVRTAIEMKAARKDLFPGPRRPSDAPLLALRLVEAGSGESRARISPGSLIVFSSSSFFFYTRRMFFYKIT